MQAAQVGHKLCFFRARIVGFTHDYAGPATCERVHAGDQSRDAAVTAELTAGKYVFIRCERRIRVTVGAGNRPLARCCIECHVVGRFITVDVGRLPIAGQAAHGNLAGAGTYNSALIRHCNRYRHCLPHLRTENAGRIGSNALYLTAADDLYQSSGRKCNTRLSVEIDRAVDAGNIQWLAANRRRRRHAGRRLAEGIGIRIAQAAGLDCLSRAGLVVSRQSGTPALAAVGTVLNAAAAGATRCGRCNAAAESRTSRAAGAVGDLHLARSDAQRRTKRRIVTT